MRLPLPLARPLSPARLLLLSLILSPVAVPCIAGSAAAEGAVRNGSDSFIAQPGSLPDMDAPGDLFASGSSVTLRGRASGDVHAAGFSVEVDLPAPQDLYAAGGSVTLRAPVGSDLSAAGFSVRTAPEATVGGNARLAGGSVTVDGPVHGALTASGGEVTLNAEVGGDVLVQAGELSFGPDARIGGRLVYTAPVATAIPASVIPADRVTWRRATDRTWPARWGQGWHPMPTLPAFMTLFSGALMVLGFLVVLGLASLAIAPNLTERLRLGAVGRPGGTLLSGFFGLAMLVGLVPVSALTLIGLPVVPFAVLAILLLWTFGYLLGAYALAAAVLESTRREDTGLLPRVLMLLIVLACLAALNFIPFLGWMLNVAVMLFGLGAMARPIFAYLGAPLPPHLPPDAPEQPPAPPPAATIDGTPV